MFHKKCRAEVELLKEKIARHKAKIAELEKSNTAAQNAAEESGRTAEFATQHMKILDELHSECRTALNALMEAVSLPVGQLPVEVQNYTQHAVEVDRLPEAIFTIQIVHDSEEMSRQSKEFVSALDLSIRAKFGTAIVAPRIFVNAEKLRCFVIIKAKTAIAMSDLATLFYHLLTTNLELHRVRQVRLDLNQRIAQYDVDERS